MKKQIVTYSIIAYSITWLIAFGIFMRFKNGDISRHQLNVLHSLAAIGPTCGALVTTYLFYGKIGVWRLIHKIRFGKPTWSALLFAFSPLLFFIMGLLVYRVVKGDWYSFQNFIGEHWSSYPVFLTWALPLCNFWGNRMERLPVAYPTTKVQCLEGHYLSYGNLGIMAYPVLFLSVRFLTRYIHWIFLWYFCGINDFDLNL